MNILASTLGVKRFRHHVLHQNSVANASLEKLGILDNHVESGVYIKETKVFSSAKEISDHPQLTGLRKTMMFVQQKFLEH